MVRERYTQEGTKELPVTVVFQAFTIGSRHSYGRADGFGESSDGPGGTRGTTVCPVRAQYYYRTAFRDAFLTAQEDDLFYCLKNEHKEWQCNLGSGRGTVKRFREERTDYR